MSATNLGHLGGRACNEPLGLVFKPYRRICPSSVTFFGVVETRVEQTICKAQSPQKSRPSFPNCHRRVRVSTNR